MITFESDYITGAHPKILENLVKSNMDMLSGYGNDKYCDSAKEKIKAELDCPDAEVHFLVGGTQTNQIIISTMLANYEGVIAATTGHVNAHEAGAIEYTGHKVLSIPGKDGKLKAEDVKKYIARFYNDGSHEHMVFPGMVYISHPTEYGTLYTLSELESISNVCKEFSIPLFLDGARLGYGLMSRDTDVTIKDIARLTDVFYIGGTKVGALCGEAVVFTHGNTPRHFIGQIKQHGALLAKGRLVGIQFDTLFTDGLYYKISKNAIDKAEKLKRIFRKRGYKFYIKSPTNQQFIVLRNDEMKSLSGKVGFGFWEELDSEHTVVRFATCWSTTNDDLKQLEAALDSVRA